MAETKTVGGKPSDFDDLYEWSGANVMETLAVVGEDGQEASPYEVKAYDGTSWFPVSEGDVLVKTELGVELEQLVDEVEKTETSDEDGSGKETKDSPGPVETKPAAVTPLKSVPTKVAAPVAK